MMVINAQHIPHTVTIQWQLRTCLAGGRSQVGSVVMSDDVTHCMMIQCVLLHDDVTLCTKFVVSQLSDDVTHCMMIQCVLLHDDVTLCTKFVVSQCRALSVVASASCTHTHTHTARKWLTSASLEATMMVINARIGFFCFPIKHSTHTGFRTAPYMCFLEPRSIPRDFVTLCPW